MLYDDTGRVVIGTENGLFVYSIMVYGLDVRAD